MTNSSNFQLELVQVLFRHGARTYIEIEAAHIPNRYLDTLQQETYGYGQLTNLGKSQAYKLGRALRNRYDDFLGSSYRPHNVYAYSSNFERTKMTLLLVLDGLYPPPAEQTWRQNLKWMPIPFSFVPEDVDILLRLYRQPRYADIFEATTKSVAAIKDKLRLPDISEFLKKKGILGLDNNLLDTLFGVYNAFAIQKIENLKLPDWITDELLDALYEYVILYFDLMSSTMELRKIISGPLIKRFIENMNINNSIFNPRKLYLYSGHDMNIAALTRAHKIENFLHADFGSAIILEKLRDAQNQFFVRMLGWTGKDENFIILKLRDCEEFCSLSDYLKIVQDIVPSDEEFNSFLNYLNSEFRKKNQ